MSLSADDITLHTLHVHYWDVCQLSHSLGQVIRVAQAVKAKHHSHQHMENPKRQ